MKYAFGRGQPNGSGEFDYTDIHHGSTIVGTLHRTGIFTHRPIGYYYDGKMLSGADLKKFDGRKFDSPLDCLACLNGEE